ncbi:hypothetical protein [Kitasatospora sp. NPDC050543]|uniref:hypothetical protein n=1 Tax=Kitasatospora sp. NPDC050543 TaxID=3364054 RepID=UPI003792182B
MAQVSHFEWHGGEWLRQAREAAAHGLELGMENVLAESKRVVPLDEGTLERSGKAQVDRSALRGTVSYDTPYATRQHEELDYRHVPGRTAKFLERPFNENREVVLDLIAAEIRRAGYRG